MGETKRAQHTALPWGVRADLDTQGRYIDILCMSEERPAVTRGTFIAKVEVAGNVARAEANAELIVRAVNAHEDLLKALKWAIRQIDTVLLETRAAHDAYDNAHAVVAKAEGRSPYDVPCAAFVEGQP